MQKIYVLLRQDQQTGPYSLEEIIQFDLKPYDLIWIEGKSAGWYYPQEIAALHPYLSFLPQKPKPAVKPPVPEKTVFVAPPKEAPQVTPLYAKPESTIQETYRPPTAASKGLEEAVYSQFKKQVDKEEPGTFTASSPQTKKRPGTLLVGTLAVLIVGGVFAASWLMNRSSNNDQTASPFVMEEISAPKELDTPAVAPTENAKNNQSPAVPNQKQGKRRDAAVKTTAMVKQTASQKTEQQPAGGQSEMAGYKTPPPPKAEDETPVNETVAVPEETKEAPQEKKKKLRDKFFDLFKKKSEEESRPVENENGERVATRRESSANLAQMMHVRFDIPNDWMMGIKGAKATLVNRSSEKIKTASVEVLYYNDDNELLQKKVVTFGKIDAKESQTISIPDHSSATKVEYNVLSVTGASQPPA
jgi:hypothetical protein